jgi:hypothetical protein
MVGESLCGRSGVGSYAGDRAGVVLRASGLEGHVGGLPHEFEGASAPVPLRAEDRGTASRYRKGSGSSTGVGSGTGACRPTGVLALAETHWEQEAPAARFAAGAGDGEVEHAGVAARLRELGYDPDFVVADARTGIIAAVEAHFDPARTKFVPSMWHRNQRIGTALTTPAGHTRPARPAPGSSTRCLTT